LATPGAVDARRGVRATAARPAQRTGTAGPGGLQPRLDRFLEYPSFKRGALTGKNPTDRAKAGSKHHLLVDRKGLPLAESLTGANVHDTHELFPLLDAVPDVKQPRGHPRHRPGKLHAEKAYSSRKNRRGLRRRGITARIARPGIESKQRLGRHRWVVERTNAWINQQRRLRVRDERRDDVHFALLVLGCCLILFRGLQT
jgi:IS5 family transposase